MSDGVFFGYGSLVNIETYSEKRPLLRARLHGFRRVWGHEVETDQGRILSLSVLENAETEIEGVLYAPRDAVEQARLDRREVGYEKIALSPDQLWRETPGDGPHLTYKSLTPPESGSDAVILQSYVDAVMQGFLRLFGPEGAARFVETTDGWEAPLHNDRSAPRYPRAVRLSSDERKIIDQLLGARLSA